MTYIIVMQPPTMPRGEYTYLCEDEEHFARVYRALEKLKVEIIDVERDGESLTTAELEEVLFLGE